MNLKCVVTDCEIMIIHHITEKKKDVTAQILTSNK